MHEKGTTRKEGSKATDVMSVLKKISQLGHLQMDGLSALACYYNSGVLCPVLPSTNALDA